MRKAYNASVVMTGGEVIAVNLGSDPYEQQIHQYGWVTLRDLEDWILGKGKCMRGGKGRKK